METTSNTLPPQDAVSDTPVSPTISVRQAKQIARLSEAGSGDLALITVSGARGEVFLSLGQIPTLDENGNDTSESEQVFYHMRSSFPGDDEPGYHLDGARLGHDVDDDFLADLRAEYDQYGHGARDDTVATMLSSSTRDPYESEMPCWVTATNMTRVLPETAQIIVRPSGDDVIRQVWRGGCPRNSCDGRGFIRVTDGREHGTHRPLCHCCMGQAMAIEDINFLHSWNPRDVDFPALAERFVRINARLQVLGRRIVSMDLPRWQIGGDFDPNAPPPVRAEPQPLHDFEAGSVVTLTHYVHDSDELVSCAICLEDYAKGTECARVPCDSAHAFHKDCIEAWVVFKTTCPMCRQKIGSSGQPNIAREVYESSTEGISRSPSPDHEDSDYEMQDADVEVDADEVVGETPAPHAE